MDHDPHHLRELIRERALSLGFARCGFAAAGPAHDAERLREWLEAGRHGEMRWLERTASRRADPAQVVAGARTLISLLAGYHHAADSPGGSSRPTGRVARYARGRDYHRVLGGRLKRLVQWLAREVGGPLGARWYVDTGPVLEKAWAQAAGLGWMGKHTNLVSTSMGSWTLCAELITTLSLPPDDPHPERCGSCASCIAACPTGAITAPHRLDARLCISYLTIELRGPIPRELRPAIGDRVFGCDDCLEVCPWNRFADAAHAAGLRDPELAPRPGQAFPGLVGLLEMDEVEFASRFHGTPLARARRSGLRRNAAVALGNVGGPGAVRPLAAALPDEDPLVRGHCAWALGRIGGPDAMAALTDRSVRESDPWVDEEISLALGPEL